MFHKLKHHQRTGHATGRTLAVAAQSLALSPVAVAPFVGYLSGVTVAAWWSHIRHRSTRPAGPRSTSFHVLIPAHDEEQLITQTIQSIRSTDYPAGQIAVHVVADHCSDATVDLARSAGAEVHEHEDPRPAGKGPALQWALDQLGETGLGDDVVVIIDADSLVNREFFSVMDHQFHHGARVVQAYYAVRDLDTSVSTGLRSAALTLRHHSRSLGRTTLGGSCGLFGNGMAFSAEVLQSRHWSHHLTEDLEFQLELLIDGVMVEYAPGAIVEAEMPATLDASRTQHERWERGRIELARRFVPVLLKQAGGVHGRRRIAVLDALVDLIVPPISVVAAATVSTAAISTTIRVLHPSRVTRLGARLSYAVTIGLIASVLSGLRLAGSPAAVYRSLLGAPRLVAWKVVLWVRMLDGSTQVAWSRTARNQRDLAA